MVVHSTLGHLLQGVRGHLHRAGSKLRLHALQSRAAKKEINHRRAWKFRRPAKSAPLGIMSFVEILVTFLERVTRGLMQWRGVILARVRTAFAGVALQRLYHLFRAR